MHIQDFYAKLVSNNEENPLFAALRKLTLLDPQAAFSADDNSIDTWVPWVAGNVESPLGEMA